MIAKVDERESIGSSEFRPDINGLRAWAVASVVLYHFGIAGFTGGYVGVDVFFVVSGLLMTGIIEGGIKVGNFSPIAFYLARGKRIIPALVVMCLVLLIAGWFLLPAGEYRMLGTHSAYSATFLSNLKFWREDGYFDVASHEKWLLHTWSLSVEWQFYLALPIALLAIHKLRIGRHRVLIAVLITFAASMALM